MDAVGGEGVFIAKESPTKGEDLVLLWKSHLSCEESFEVGEVGGGAGGDGEGAVVSDKDLDTALQRWKGV